MILTIILYLVGQLMEDQENMKVNIPGLCIYRKESSLCKEKSYCFCCLMNDMCYVSIDNCKSGCVKQAPLGTVDSQKPALFSSHVIYG